MHLARLVLELWCPHLQHLVVCLLLWLVLRLSLLQGVDRIPNLVHEVFLHSSIGVGSTDLQARS